MSPLKVTPKLDQTQFSPVGPGGLQKHLEKYGRLPPVTLLVTPLDGSKPITLDRFLTYNFKSSILVPVDQFTFTFVAPDDPQPFPNRVKEGDLITLFANGQPLATGIIDVVDVEVDNAYGEKVTVSGRDLTGQLADQDAVSINSEAIYGGQFSIAQAASKLIEATRIPRVLVQDATKQSKWLFATEPSESKLDALMRFLDPLNVLFWAGPTGSLIISKPNFAQATQGLLILSKERRKSNVFNMKAIRESNTIPNKVLPVWAGAELAQSAYPIREQALNNPAKGPARLRRLGSVLQKTSVFSSPQGTSAQDQSQVNLLTAGSSNLMQSIAKRLLSRGNHKELIVQATVLGHYNEKAKPYAVNQTYDVVFDRGAVDKKMFLFEVDYSGGEEGQKTNLFLCNLNTMVSDGKVK